MPVASLAVIGATIVLSSFISGVFGMAGGMLLLGVLLSVLDVARAMVLLSLVQLMTNGWRLVYWRREVRWSLFFVYAFGALAAAAAMRLVAYVPPKPLVYLLLGAIPIALELLPARARPNIEWTGVPVLSGLVVTVVQLLSGVGGVFLDVFFRNSSLDRKATNGTKAVIQAFNHVVRAAYFGSLMSAGGLTLGAVAPALALAGVGSALAPRVLERMTDDSFRSWTRALVLTISVVYLARGGWLWRLHPRAGLAASTGGTR